jgi:copper transport protein
MSALTSVPAGSPLDDFLNRTDTASGSGELVRDIGGTMAMAGLLLAIGTVVFLARVHRGSLAEVRSLLLVAGFGGVLTLAGASAELAGIQAVFETGWSEVFSVDAGSAPMLRLLAGLLLVFGLGTATVAVDPGGSGPASVVRWVPGAESAFGLVGLAVGAFSFAFDGHTVTEGPRGVHLMASLVHVAAGGVWAGGVVALVAVAVLRHRAQTGSIAELVVRFSSVATVALAAVAAAGALMAVLVLDDVDELTDTVWGQRLTIKVAAVGVAAALGAYHHLVTVRRLDRPGGVDAAELARVRTTLTIEAIALVFVVIASGLLVNGSTV